MTKIHDAYPHLVDLPAFRLGEPKPPASLSVPRMTQGEYADLQKHPYGLPRGTFSRPVVVDPVPNHTDLAEKIATARYWERVTGVKTPFQIEQIIQSWELDR
jgi:hypothetical protein